MKYILWISALVFLSACTVSADVPNRVTVKPDGSVTIGTSSSKSNGGGAYQNGNFCPPGQEKKGNCHH